MDICFLITTYNRQESCQRLVDSLQGLGDIVVAHDGNNYTINGATNINPNIHLGKAGYWRLINMLYRNRPICKMYLMLPDDCAICNSQIANAIEIWESIRDPQKICLSLGEGRPNHMCWTGFRAVEKETAWLTQWVDMCFLCEEKFFTVLGVIPDLHRENRTKGSSGVGAYISRKLMKNGFNMYQVKEPIVIMTEEHNKSQMHYDYSTLSHNTR
jgi:hypothetical protein